MTESGALNSDFWDILAELRAASAQHLIVGAHALAAHGIARATGDLDILVNATPENAPRVYAALVAFGAPLEAHVTSPDDFASPGLVYQMGLPPKRIDVLTSISGVSFDDAWTSRATRVVNGAALNFLGLDDLKTNKRASGRTKDLLDLALLEEAGL